MVCMGSIVLCVSQWYPTLPAVSLWIVVTVTLVCIVVVAVSCVIVAFSIGIAIKGEESHMTH